MNNSYNLNQPAFTANFIAKGIKLNPEKLGAVQNRFSKLTQHYKDEHLTVMPAKISGAEYVDDTITAPITIADFYTKNDNPASIITLDNFKQWFRIASVDEIAKTLTRIFKAGKFNEIQEAKLKGLKKDLNHVQSSLKSNTQKGELTHRQIYYSLAAHNSAKAAFLEKELANAEYYADSTRLRIQGYPVDAQVQWRYE